jgi:hypothetical protein
VEQGQEQSGRGGNLSNVVSGYGPLWGTAPAPPRYDTAGRPVGAGKTGSAEWWKAIPPGYQLVPVGGTPADSKIQKSDGGAQGKRQHGEPQGERAAKRPAKTFKVEGASRSDVQGSGQLPRPLNTREERLRNHEQYLAQRGPRTPFVPRPGTTCFYCGKPGHFVRVCKLKKEDLAAGEAAENAGAAGNDQRA